MNLSELLFHFLKNIANTFDFDLSFDFDFNNSK